MYATAADLESRYPAKDLAELTDVNGVTINVVTVNAALSDASDEIDTFLMGRYQLPLTEIPSVLTVTCCTIAMYRLSAFRTGTAVDDVRNRYKDAVAFLTKVANGTAQLGVSAVDQVAAVQADGPIVQTTTTPTRTFDRASMKGF